MPLLHKNKFHSNGRKRMQKVMVALPLTNFHIKLHGTVQVCKISSNSFKSIWLDIPTALFTWTSNKVISHDMHIHSPVFNQNKPLWPNCLIWRWRRRRRSSRSCTSTYVVNRRYRCCTCPDVPSQHVYLLCTWPFIFLLLHLWLQCLFMYFFPPLPSTLYSLLSPCLLLADKRLPAIKAKMITLTERECAQQL